MNITSMGFARLIFLAFCLCLMVSTLSARTWHVTTTGDNTKDGTTWANAVTLQYALVSAVTGDEIWVAAGTYKPTQDPFGSTTPTDPRDKTFYLKDGVKIYGGFFGDESLLSGRHGAASILSGDIGTALNKTDNCYHVVLTVADAATTLLDGVCSNHYRSNLYCTKRCRQHRT